MPRKRRNPKIRHVEIPADMIDYLSDRETGNPWIYFTSDDELRAAWNEVRDEILAAWIAIAPGTRPSHWWLWFSGIPPAGSDALHVDSAA